MSFDGLLYVAGYDDIAAVLGPLGNAQAIIEMALIDSTPSPPSSGQGA